GQNVNKVNSKVTLRWNPARNTSLPMPVRDRFLERYRSRLTTAGDLIVTSQRYRDQGRNVDDCLEKLRLMIATVAVAPVKRKKTRPSRASVERRLDEKRAVSQKKQRRRSDS
ncbi:MAG TPA: alternative ribosome rescue aminoacyl-tRNA hydrolase ArfB, partial [Pirellulales bacterium]|nr:alternative ribosome rescue aminoacyl-tRNA hydrolase ArfB [Pirellulales bacterium]